MPSPTTARCTCMRHYCVFVLNSSIIHACNYYATSIHPKYATDKFSLPTLHELTILKYTTSKGEKRRLSIINEACHKWKDIISLICDDSNRVGVLEDEYRGKPHDCLRQALTDDFIGKKPQRYSHDWNGLIEVLEDVGLESVAKKAKDAFSTNKSSLPTLQELTILKYTTHKGEKRRLSIINEACHKWKDIISLICDDSNRARVLEDEYRGKPHDCLRQALTDDFIGKKPQRYSHDWNGLIEVLEDVGLESVAEKANDALWYNQ